MKRKELGHAEEAMILPYLARLVCLCLAVFFLVHAALGLAVSLLTPWAVRIAGRMAPVTARGSFSSAALSGRLRDFRGRRTLYAELSVSRTAGRPRRDGRGLYGRGAGGSRCLGFSVARASRAMVRSARHIRQCRERSREMRLPGERNTAWVIESAAPCVMLTGVWRTRIVVSSAVLAALSAEELSAVIRHERAHGVHRDNLNRLLLLLAPGMLPPASGFRSWSRPGQDSRNGRPTIAR
jgi:Zn-dependent protease with chaperone function